MGDPVRDYLGGAQQSQPQADDPVAGYLNAAPSSGVSEESNPPMPADQLSARRQEPDVNQQIAQLQAMRDQPGTSSEKRIEINKAIDKLHHPILYGLTGYAGNYHQRDWAENMARGVIGGAVGNGILGTADLLGAGLQLVLPKAAEDAIGLGKAREDLQRHRQMVLDKADAEGAAGALGNVGGSFYVGGKTFGKIGHATTKAILRYGPNSGVTRAIVRGMSPGASYVDRFFANAVGNSAVDGVQLLDIYSNDQLSDKEKYQQMLIAVGMTAGINAVVSLPKNRVGIASPAGDKGSEVTLDAGNQPSAEATQAAAEMDAKIAAAKASAKSSRGAALWWNKLTVEQRAQIIPGIEQEVAGKRFNQMPDAWQQKIIEADQTRRAKGKPAGSEKAPIPEPDGSVGQPTNGDQMGSELPRETPSAETIQEIRDEDAADKLIRETRTPGKAPDPQRAKDLLASLPSDSKLNNSDLAYKMWIEANPHLLTARNKEEAVADLRGMIGSPMTREGRQSHLDAIGHMAQYYQEKFGITAKDLKNIPGVAAEKNSLERAQRQRELFEQINKAVEQRDLPTVKRLREELDNITGQGPSDPNATSVSPRPSGPVEPTPAEGAPPARELIRRNPETGELEHVNVNDLPPEERPSLRDGVALKEQELDSFAQTDVFDGLDNIKTDADNTLYEQILDNKVPKGKLTPEQEAKLAKIHKELDELKQHARDAGEEDIDDIGTMRGYDKNALPAKLAEKDATGAELTQDVHNPGKLDKDGNPELMYPKGTVLTPEIIQEMRDAGWDHVSTDKGELEIVHFGELPSPEETGATKLPDHSTEDANAVDDYLNNLDNSSPEEDVPEPGLNKAQEDSGHMLIEKQLDDLTARIMKNIEDRQRIIEDDPRDSFDNDPKYKQLKKEYNDLIVERNRLEKKLSELDKPKDNTLHIDRNKPFVDGEGNKIDKAEYDEYWNEINWFNDVAGKTHNGDHANHELIRKWLELGPNDPVPTDWTKLTPEQKQTWLESFSRSMDEQMGALEDKLREQFDDDAQGDEPWAVDAHNADEMPPSEYEMQAWWDKLTPEERDEIGNNISIESGLGARKWDELPQHIKNRIYESYQGNVMRDRGRTNPSSAPQSPDEAIDALLRDVEDRYQQKRHNSELERRLNDAERIAFTDELTGVGNRHLFRKILRIGDRPLTEGEGLEYAQAPKGKKIILLDVKNLGAANEMHGGQIAGDGYLISIVEGIKQALDYVGVDRADANIMRIGGDEFALVVDEEFAKVLTSAIRDQIGEPPLGDKHVGGVYTAEGDVFGAVAEKLAKVKEADPTRIKNIIKEQLKKGQKPAEAKQIGTPIQKAIEKIRKALTDGNERGARSGVEELQRVLRPLGIEYDPLDPNAPSHMFHPKDVERWLKSVEEKSGLSKRADQRTPEQLSHKDQVGPITKEDQPLENLELKKPLEDHTEDELDKLIDKLDTVEEKDPTKSDAVGRDLFKIAKARKGIRAAQDKARVKPAEQLPGESKPILDKDAALANQGKQVSEDRARVRKLLSTKPKAMSNDDLAFMAQWLEAEQKRLTSAGEKQSAKDVQKKWADIIDEIQKRNGPGGAGAAGITLASRPEVGGAIIGFVGGYSTADDNDDNETKIERALAGAAIGAFAANRLARRQAAQALKDLPLYQQKIREHVKSVEDGEQSRRGFWQWLNDVYTKGVRYAHPIEQATKALGGSNLPFTKNPGKQASVFGLYRAMADSWLFDRPSFINASGDRSFFDALGLRAIGQMVKGDLRSLGDYWAAARALELAGQPKPRSTGIDLVAARQFFVGEFDKYHGAMLELVKYARALADVGVLSGTLSSESRAKFADVYYAPLHRLFNGELGSSPKSISTIGERGNTAAQTPDVYKYLKGSVREILNPVESLIQNTARTLRAAEFNRVAVSLANLADAAREGGSKDIADMLMKRVSNIKSPITELQIKSVKDMMEDLGTSISHEDAERIVLTMSNETLNVQDDVLRFYRNGRLETYKINSALAQAFKAMSPQELDNMLIPLIGDAAKKVSSAARVGITANPVFIGYQAFRDNWQFMLNSKYGFTPGIDQARGWWKIVSGSAEYKRYIALGGSGDTIADQGLQVVRGKSATLDAVKQAPSSNVLMEAINQAKTLHPLKAYATLVAPIADAGRFGAYLHAVGRGIEPIEAIWAAKHAGGNFSQRGSSTGLRALNMMSLFLNASLQSMDASARAFKDHPLRYTISAATGITLPSMLLWFAYKDDKEIVDLRTSDSGRKYWWIRAPMDAPGIKAGEIIKIPKPIVDGQIWGTTAEAALDKMLQDNPDAIEGMARSIYNDAKFNLLPTIGVIPYSVWNNQDIQSGRSIVPDGASKLDLQYQAAENTTDAARVIGGIVAPALEHDPTGVVSPFGSPAAIDYTARGLFGTFGGDVMKGVSMLLDKNRPGWTPLKDELPIVGNVFAKNPTLNVGSIQEFYNHAERADATIKTLKYLAESQPDKAQNYLDTRWDDLQTAGMYVEVRQKLADLRAAIANIQQAPDDLIPVNQKREMSQDLMRAMIDLAREANSAARSMNQSSTK
jgi:GGDEF domain-containing protein